MTNTKACDIRTLDEARARREGRRSLRRLCALTIFVALAAAVFTWQFAQGMGQDREIDQLTGRLGAVERRTAYMQRQLGIEIDLETGMVSEMPLRTNRI